MSDFKILIFDNYNKSLWDSFVKKKNITTIEHLFEWKNILKKTYNLDSLYLGIKIKNQIVSVCPFIITNFLFKKKAISFPYLCSGGVLVNDEISKRFAENIYAEYLYNNKISYVEFRFIDKSNKTSSYVSSRINLPSSKEIYWNSLKSNHRRKIKKAEKNDFKFVIKKTNTFEYYQIYLRGLKKHGVPPHSINLFHNVLKYFKDQVNVLQVTHANKIIASMVLISCNKSISAPFIFSNPKYLNNLCNYYLYWEAINFAIENNYEYFDLGRSISNSGNEKFKNMWNAKSTPLCTHVFDEKKLLKSSTTSINSYFKLQYRIISSIWSNMPLLIHSNIGPKLRKYIV